MDLLDRLTQQGLFDSDGKMLSPHNWSKRQFSEDRRPKAPDQSDYKGNYIYIIGTTLDRPVKIGISKNPWSRCSELQTASPEKLSLLGIFRAEIRRDTGIHQLLANFRLHGEWFALPVHLQEIIAQAVVDKDNYGELAVRLREALRSSTTELRSEPTTLLHQKQKQSRAETEQRQRQRQKQKQSNGHNASAANNHRLYADEPHASRFSFEEIKAYCEATKHRTDNPGGLARALYRSGEEDSDIARWIENNERKARLSVGALTGPNDDFDFGGYIEGLIARNDNAQLQHERQGIEDRGGPKDQWERRVFDYFKQSAAEDNEAA